MGVSLAAEGKKVLLVDAEPQGSLTISMGWQQPDELPTTLSTLIQKAMNDQPIQPGEGILYHAEGVDLIPANIELAGLEVALVNSMNREKMLKQVLDGAKREYDYILLDCTPSLGMLTINALAAADTALIPVQAQYLSAKGLEQLLQTICKVHLQKINPRLKIEGIFDVRIRRTIRAASNRQDFFAAGILPDQFLLPLCKCEISILKMRIVFVLQRIFPVTLGCVHLVDGIIDFIQQFCIALFHHRIKIACNKFFQNTFAFCTSQGTGNDCIDCSLLQSLRHLIRR